MNFDSIQPFLDWMQTHPALAGLVIFLVACAESLVVVGVMVPGIAFMLGVGALVGLGALDLWPTLAWATLGAVVGDGVSYWVGRHYDRQLRTIWPFTKHPELLPRGERFFRKHGALSVVIGRFVGPLRAVIPAIAGIMRMNPWAFYTVNIASAIAWAPVVILPGVAVGASMHLASELAGRLMVVFLILLLMVWGLFVMARLLDRTVIAPYLRHSARFGKIDYQHMPGLFLKYLLESSLGVFVVTLMLGALLAGYTQEETKLEFPVLDKQQWIQDGWKQFVVARDIDNERDPFTVQWWTSRSELEHRLKHNGWTAAVELDYRNALLWLSPSLEIQSLPMFSQGFGVQQHQFMFVSAQTDKQKLWLLRIWLAYPGVQDDKVLNSEAVDNKTLWLATVKQLEFYNFFGFRHPAVSKSEHTLQRMKNLAVSNDVRIERLSKNSVSSIEVLLIPD